MDVMSPQQRSHCMSRIRGKDTQPEMALRSALWSAGLRFRIHYPIAGKPDIVFPRARTVVFVDGCFWHGCRQHGVEPKSNSAFWRKKIGRNVERDEAVSAVLASHGWSVLRYWEHEVNTELPRVIHEILRAVRRSSAPAR